MGNVSTGLNEHRTSSVCTRTSHPCPTCRGSGVVQENVDSNGELSGGGVGDGNEYIALIPLSDSRLRPRHTALKVSVAVIFCLLISCVLLFFLILRSAQIHSDCPLIIPYGVLIDENDAFVALNITNPFNFTNYNYFPVHVEQISMLSLYHSTVINDTKTPVDVWIPTRSTTQLSINQSLIFKGPPFSDYLPNLCQSNNTEFNRIYIRFGFEVVARTLGQRVDVIMDTVQLVSCYQPPP